VPTRPLTARPPVGLSTQLMLALAAILAGPALCAPAPAGGQAADTPAVPPTAPGVWPFFVGERFDYKVRVAKVGNVGHVAMWVEGPVDVRGVETYLLRFDFKARVGPVKAADRTWSWIDPLAMASYRFKKHERHPLSRHDEEVELFPAEHRWLAADGASGASLDHAPLDELSFMYFIRTLAYTPDTVYRFDRHYDAARNPTTVRVVRRETVTTGAGQFRTVLLEMRVKDPRRYKGEGVIRINVTDDHCRLPVRIQSTVPVIGTAVMTLESHTHPPQHRAAPEL
jgi:hypothetical protein